jgi:phosphoglycolate phosphatase
MLPCPAVELTTCKLIAFDLDGTLYPSGIEIGKIVLVAHAEYVRQHKIDLETPDLAWVQHLIGADAKSFYREMLPGQPQAVIDDFENYCLEYERGVVARFPALFPGADAVLDNLHHCGRTLVLVTNGGPTYAQHVWDAAGLGRWLRARYPYAPPEYATKGERLARAIEEWGGGPAVMVGDRRSDGEAAQYAGAAFIGAAYGYGTPDELTAAAYVITHMAQLYNLLLSPEEQRQCGII